ncbi:hypothetical protein SAMN02745172_00607 [Pseudoxanthobacter soli DSM 19599]|uniref:Uncharacterized protein n=2 Tax=Pseudoxanthobacter TaxID=433838 RepID=A0A1M7Z8M4_9HYPH|nr:hypothetical protein SAMN02745172_00607 [Pseudoxanthobacter soli DSM 19599]
MKSEVYMLTKVQMYARTAPGRGFLQHFRLLTDSPLHLPGVCYGASVEWLSSYYLNDGDRRFWEKYSNPFKSHHEIVTAHDTKRSSAGLKICDPGMPGAPTDPQLWRSGHESGLKYYRVGFETGILSKKMMAHAMAAYTTGDDRRGSLFDPNIGQYDIGEGYYKDWPSLWKDLWEYYDFKSVEACDVIPARMVHHTDGDDFVHVDYDTLLTFSPGSSAAASHAPPPPSASAASGLKRSDSTDSFTLID